MTLACWCVLHANMSAAAAAWMAVHCRLLASEVQTVECCLSHSSLCCSSCHCVCAAAWLAVLWAALVVELRTTCLRQSLHKFSCVLLCCSCLAVCAAVWPAALGPAAGSGAADDPR
jgi:hypothetical protein